MRTTVIPAQITTVEDKIAGSLNLTQILILMVPVFWATIVYSILPPRLHLEWYKLPIILTALILCLILSLRIKGKVILNWLLLLISYNMRPRYYLFNKNDSFLRKIDLPKPENKTHKLFKKAYKKKEIKIPASAFGIKDLMKLKEYISNPSYTLSLKPDEKGGLYVALEQIR